MKLYAVKYAESVFAEKYIFKGGREDTLLPISFTIFLIEADGRRILVDAGCDTMPGWDMRHYLPPSEILEREGISPDKITDVIITHSHHDHVDGIRHYPNARVYIQENEYKACKEYFPKNADVFLFSDKAEVATGITVRKIGGHTDDSCIVEITYDDRTVIISGDEIYNERSVTELIPLGNSKNPEVSLDFVRKYSDSRYKVIVMHSPTFLPDSNGIEEIQL